MTFRYYFKKEPHHFLIAIGIILFILIGFFLKPYLHKKSAVNVVEIVLKNWQNKDLLRAIDQWDNPDKYPPIYNLVDYKIVKKEFTKNKGAYSAKFHVELEFSAGNLIPSGKEWIFELKDKRPGWRIMDFYLSENNNPFDRPSPSF